MNKGIITEGKPNKPIYMAALHAAWHKFIRLDLSRQERILVINYLQNIKVEGMRKHLCFSCRYCTLYDKNNKAYLVSRTDSLERVKSIVEKIRKINQSE